jgi:hypothetical protein
VKKESLDDPKPSIQKEINSALSRFKTLDVRFSQKALKQSTLESLNNNFLIYVVV